MSSESNSDDAVNDSEVPKVATDPRVFLEGDGGSNDERFFSGRFQKEDLEVAASDHPGFQLVTVPLDESNWIAWKSAIEVALGCKFKLGFIDGSLCAPPATDPLYRHWRRADCLVVSWLKNSISKSLIRAFAHINTSRELWIELEEQYGRIHGAHILHLRRRFVNLQQGTLTVAQYYTELLSIWRDLMSIDPYPKCSIEATRILAERDDRNLLIQFLMGLNDEYSSSCNQILLLDPLPSVRKAYGMICNVESQKYLMNFNLTKSEVALSAVSNKPNWKNKDRKKAICEH